MPLKDCSARDKYTYPSSPVLINIPGIRDGERLEQFEADTVFRRELSPGPGKRELALKAGYRVAWDGISRDELYAASGTSMHQNDLTHLRAILLGVTTAI